MNELWLVIVRKAALEHGMDGEALLAKLPPMPSPEDLTTQAEWLRLIDPNKLKTSLEEDLVIEKCLAEFLAALSRMAAKKLRTEFRPGQG